MGTYLVRYAASIDLAVTVEASDEDTAAEASLTQASSTSRPSTATAATCAPRSASTGSVPTRLNPRTPRPDRGD